MSRARDIANFGDGIATADIGDGQVTAGKLNSTLDLSSKTLTLPAGYLETQETAVTGLSGASSVEYTGLPSNVQSITVVLLAVSHSTQGNPIQIKLGDSTTNGYATGVYNFNEAYIDNSGQGAFNRSSRDGFRFEAFTGDGNEITAIAHIQSLGANNKWICTLQATTSNNNTYAIWIQGFTTLAGTLDRVKVEPTAGNLDGGSVNIYYT